MFIAAPVYTNSLLVTLNARNIIRDAGNTTNQASYAVPLSQIINEAKNEDSSANSSASTKNLPIGPKITNSSYPSDATIGLEFRKIREVDSLNA